MADTTTNPTANPMTDPHQTEVYPDMSYKHVARAVRYNFISMNTDNWSGISFRQYQRREVATNQDSVYVHVWRTITTSDMKNERESLVTEDRDVVWDSDSDARYLIRAEWLDDPCTIEVEWHWNNGTTPKSGRKASLWYRAEAFMPTYCSLSDSERLLCDSILGRFSLLRDNHYGNGMPNLAEDVQTSYSLEDIAECMYIAMQKINMTAIQPTDYHLGQDANGQSFPEVWYNLLMVETLIEVVRKLVWGYLETPDINGNTGVAFASRDEYWSRWRTILGDLQSDAKALEDSYKRQTLNLTASSTLVGGGIYGRGSGFISNRMLQAIQRGWIQNMHIAPDIVVADPNS